MLDNLPTIGFEGFTVKDLLHTLSRVAFQVGLLLFRILRMAFTRFPLNYSLKNIPIPTELFYKKNMTRRIEELPLKFRKKLYFHKNPNHKKKDLKTFGFNSPWYPKTDPDLKQFEEDMIGLISSIEMRRHENELQRRMREDINRIKNSSNIIISADKTGNLYEISPDEYKRHLKNSITSTYRRKGVTYAIQRRPLLHCRTGREDSTRGVR